jgi:hypothetical protein
MLLWSNRTWHLSAKLQCYILEAVPLVATMITSHSILECCCVVMWCHVVSQTAPASIFRIEWRQGHQGSMKYWHLSTKLDGDTSQKTVIFTSPCDNLKPGISVCLVSAVFADLPLARGRHIIRFWGISTHRVKHWQWDYGCLEYTVACCC